MASPMTKTTQVTRLKSPRSAVGHPLGLKDFHHEIKKLRASLMYINLKGKMKSAHQLLWNLRSLHG